MLILGESVSVKDYTQFVFSILFFWYSHLFLTIQFLFCYQHINTFHKWFLGKIPTFLTYIWDINVQRDINIIRMLKDIPFCSLLEYGIRNRSFFSISAHKQLLRFLLLGTLHIYLGHSPKFFQVASILFQMEIMHLDKNVIISAINYI